MDSGDLGQSIYDLYPLTEEKRKLKIQSIETAYDLRDTNLLAEFASSREGLINDELRRKVWPLLLGIDNDDKESINGLRGNSVDKTPHAEEDQVKLDVDRGFIFYPKFNDKSEEVVEDEKTQLKKKLGKLITTVLRNNPQLSYYQGYHDIAQLLLLVFDRDEVKAARILEYLSRYFLRDFMLPDISATIDQLKLIPPLLMLGDPYIGSIVRDIEPFYALSPMLTYMAHHVQSYKLICNVFDYILAKNDPSAILYFYSALVICKRKEIKQADGGGDKDILHSVLSNLVEEKEPGVDIIDVIKKSDQLMRDHPVSTLGTPWKRLMKFSVLRTGQYNGNDSDFTDTLNAQIKEQESRPIEKSGKGSQGKYENSISPQNVIKMSIFMGVLGVVGFYLTQHYITDKMTL